MTTDHNSFVWICPGCGRRVPRRLEQCRCGFEQSLAGPPPPTAAEPEPPGRPARSLVPTVLTSIVAAIVLVALAAFVAVRVFRPGPQAAPRPDSVLTPSAAPAPELASTAGEPGMPDEGPVTPAPEPAPPVQLVPPGSNLAPAPPAAPAGAAPSLEDVISASIPAVVSIETAEGKGSGFFVAPQVVLTNGHVVSGNVSVTVRLPSGATLPGRVETTSTDFDLAVVRVDGAPASQPVLPLGSAASVRAGQEVIAIGLALGVFQNTVTRGIISAVRRAGSTVVLQTDAAINPGNSGGPLLNRSGQVVGITTLKVTGMAESLGFAVAIDHAAGLLAGGRPVDPSLAAASPPSAPLAPAFSGQSTSDQLRQTGGETFEKVVAVLAQRGAEIDDYWGRIRRICPMRVAPGYDREWFGLWDNRVTLADQDPTCIGAIRDVNGLAADVRAAMTGAQENARRAGVYPGQLRDIRRRYRMDWPGWDR